MLRFLIGIICILLHRPKKLTLAHQAVNLTIDYQSKKTDLKSTLKLHNHNCSTFFAPPFLALCIFCHTFLFFFLHTSDKLLQLLTFLCRISLGSIGSFINKLIKLFRFDLIKTEVMSLIINFPIWVEPTKKVSAPSQPGNFNFWAKAKLKKESALASICIWGSL